MAASDKHYEILASHGRYDAIPRDRREKAIADANAARSAGQANMRNIFGGIFGGSSSNPNSSQRKPGYKNFRDTYDGGGQYKSGARFARGDISMFDLDDNDYISEAEFISAKEKFPDIYQKQVMGGIPALSNMIGARPRGSYEKERELKSKGINIGTSGIANFVSGAGVLGNVLRGGRPTKMMMADPNMPPGARFTPQNVQQYRDNPAYLESNPNAAPGQSSLRNFPLGLGPGIDMLRGGAALSNNPQERYYFLLGKGYTPEEAAEYLSKTDQNAGRPPTDYVGQFGTNPTQPTMGMPIPSSNRLYSPRPVLRPSGPPQIPATPRPFNMGGLLALRDYNMGMQMGMGQSV